MTDSLRAYEIVKADRETDFRVAGEVMGWSNLSRGESGLDAFGWHPNFRDLPQHGRVPVPHYSTSFLAVHDVLHQLRRRFGFAIAIESDDGGTAGWHAQVRGEDDDTPWFYAPKLAHAICLAALHAVSSRIPDAASVEPSRLP